MLAARPLMAPTRADRALLGCEPPNIGRLLGLGGVLAVALLAGACADPASGAQGSCAAQDVGEARCRAIVNEAGTRLPKGGAPIIATEVRIPTLADRDTLRAQQLVATVRFSLLDGSDVEVPVFCSPRLADTAVCREAAP